MCFEQLFSLIYITFHYLVFTSWSEQLHKYCWRNFFKTLENGR